MKTKKCYPITERVINLKKTYNKNYLKIINKIKKTSFWIVSKIIIKYKRKMKMRKMFYEAYFRFEYQIREKIFFI